MLYQFGQEDLRKLAKKEGGYQLVDIEVSAMLGSWPTYVHGYRPYATGTDNTM